MRRVLLEENLDRRLKRAFDPASRVVTVQEQGWSGTQNGELLRVASTEFDVLVTLDQNMQFQQHLPAYDLAVILIKARSHRRSDIEPAMAAVNRALQEVKTGSFVTVTALDIDRDA